MFTASVSNSVVNQATSYFQQRLADLRQLGKDLKAGDLTAAQNDFAAIQTLAQSGPLANGDAFKISGRQQDFAAVGQALEAGDLAGAQQAFAQLQGTFDHHQHVVPSPAAVVNLSSVSATADSQATGANPPATGTEIVLNLGDIPAGEQITIGLSNASNGGEKVTISLANQASQNSEQITFNLQKNSNQEIILNLFNGTSASQSQSSAVSVTA